MKLVDETDFRTLYEETRKKFDELTILYEMTKISIASPSLDQMLVEIVKSLKGLLILDSLGIFLIDENTGKLYLHPSSIGLLKEDTQRFSLLLEDRINKWTLAREDLVPDGHALKELTTPEDSRDPLGEV